jgi:hypothetical protein
MVETKWHINGDYLLACNCDYGCPCNFNARPTPGTCEAALGVVVNDGAFGNVSLNGLQFVYTAKWPAAIHEGNGVAAMYFDESASPEQRSALQQIISGQAGGLPFSILAGTWSRLLEPRITKVRVESAGKDSVVEVDGLVRFAFQPIRNPVTKAEAYPKVVLPQGFIFKEGDQYSLGEFWVRDTPELTYAYPGKCAELAHVQWGGP